MLGIPISIGFGWLQTKRNPPFGSAIEIIAEANPCYHRLRQGGYDRIVRVPTYLELLELSKQLVAAQGILKPEAAWRMDDLEKNFGH